MDPQSPLLPDTLTQPPRRIRWLALLARVLLWLVVSFWVVFGASWGLLHGQIVPRIGEYRPRLEVQASRALGMPVRIGHITAHSEGLIPSFEMRDVVLLDADGREALRLPRVLVALSPKSLWGMGFEQLSIDRPDLEIRRAATGKLYVGGLDVSQGRVDGNAAANWFFSQAEFAIRGGTIRWVDELRGAPPLALTQVDAVVRNTRRRHTMRLDATPPPEWGERFSLRGIFRQPLLSSEPGLWADWSGQLYAEFERVDISRVSPYISLDSLGMAITAGSGSLRAWADVGRGQITGGTADVALAGVNARLGQALKPLALTSMTGRLGGRRLASGFEFNTTALRFDTADGLRWPGGNASVVHSSAVGATLARTELKADRLDLAALAQIATRLPLSEAMRLQIDSFAPKGLVETIDARWQGSADQSAAFSAKGRVSGLTLAARDSQGQTLGSAANQNLRPAPGRPGLSGATVDFDITHTGGRANISIVQGALELPGIFEAPRIAMNQLSMNAQWTLTDGQIDTQLRNIRFSNADAEGALQASWRSAPAPAPGKSALATGLDTALPDKASSDKGSLGVLDVQGTLSRANGAQVYRYLPLVLPERSRHYVRDAVLRGDLSELKFKVKGAVNDIPYAGLVPGDFKISTRVKNGTLAYVPPSLQPVGSAPWPALTDLTGELVFNNAALRVNGATGRVQGLGGLQLVKVDARIDDLAHAATVEVTAAVKGPVSDALAFVNTSPIGALTGQVLEKAVATGTADYALRLSLPLSALDKTRVQGSMTLPGNDVRITPASPLLARVKGVVTFSESGFNVAAVQARFLGGDIRLEGGLRAPARAGASGTAGTPGNELDTSAVFKAQGHVTAEGLRQAKDLGLVSRLAQNASGSAAYSATLGFRRGMAEISVASNLQGMALSLPAPLGKAAETMLPLRFEHTLQRDSLAPGQKLQDQLSLSIGSLASVVYVRDISGAEPRVVRGSMGVGLEAAESAPLPDSGVAANINLADVDIDAWQKVFSAATGSDAVGAPAAAETVVMSYLPTRMAIRARQLQLEGRQLHQVVVGATRDGPNWRANIDAQELNGYIEFRQPGAGVGLGSGRVFARLSRLRLAPNTASEFESLLDQQPASIPALDIVVDDLELRGRKLGRVEIEAINRGAFVALREGGAREWRLNKFNIILPEAVFTATGNWAAVNPQPAAAASLPQRRRTTMDFKLEIADSGELLKRFGMQDVIRLGKGSLQGQVAWTGSPLSPNYPSMGGQFNINIESGQFLKADPGIAKLLGVLSLQSLPRRLALDFRDVFSEGFAFDFVRGDVAIAQGLASTNNLQMRGVNAAVLMDGSADIAKETQDIKVVVVPEINAGTASLIATVINPAIGLGTFLAQYFLRRPLIQAATQEFHIDGSWADPKITKVTKITKTGTNP
ncbi:MAG: TIGR02099 family protein [Polaromonas sp.]|nr:MAG: TIGR02099 family protein [Polaromonas sp.]